MWLRPSKVRPWVEELGDSGRPSGKVDFIPLVTIRRVV